MDNVPSGRDLGALRALNAVIKPMSSRLRDLRGRGKRGEEDSESQRWWMTPGRQQLPDTQEQMHTRTRD